MSRQRTPAALYAVRYWPSWLALGVLRLLTLLPRRPLLASGRLLGRLALRFARRRAQIARVNLRLCFPELSDAELAALLQQHFESLGMGIMEALLAWWAPDHRLQPLVKISGAEHVRRALANGQGILLLTAHFSTMELGSRFLTLELPVNNAVYRPDNRPVVEHMIRRNRAARGVRTIPREDVRSMVKVLRQGEILWFASDQNFGHKYGLFVDFFDIPAATNTTTSRLASAGKALVITYYCRRRPDLSGYDINLSAPLANFPSGDLHADTGRINKIIEGWARESPADYFWLHRRFKDRPDNAPSFYDSLG